MGAFSVEQGAYFEFVKSVKHEPFNMPSVIDLGSQLDGYSLPRNFVLTLKSNVESKEYKAYLDYMDLIIITSYKTWLSDHWNHSRSSHLSLVKDFASFLNSAQRNDFINEIQYSLVRFLSSYQPSGVEVCSTLQNIGLKPNVLWRVYSTSWGTWSPRLRSGRPMPPYVSFLLSNLFLYRSSGYILPEVEELMSFSVLRKTESLTGTETQQFSALKKIAFQNDTPIGVPLSQSQHWFESNAGARLCFEFEDKAYSLNAVQVMQIYLGKTYPDNLPASILEEKSLAELHICALSFFLVSQLSVGTVAHLYYAFKAHAEFIPDMQLSFKSVFQSMPSEKDKPRSAMPHTVIFPYLFKLGKLDGLPYGDY